MNLLFPPVAAGANVYVYGQSKDDKGVKLGCAIHAFDAKDGTLRWKWETQECSGPEDNPLSLLTADASAAYLTIDGKDVDGKWGAVFAFDAATGKQMWRVPSVQFHPAGATILDASTVVICDNTPGDHGGTANARKPYVLRGLDRATGQMKWESQTAWKYGNWIAQDGLMFVGDRLAHALIGTGNDTSPDGFLTVVDMRSAKELWRSAVLPLASMTTPAVAEGVVVVGSLPFGESNNENGGLFAFRAKASPNP
jgi:outer membrane protein assembly factor BamB